MMPNLGRLRARINQIGIAALLPRLHCQQLSSQQWQQLVCVLLACGCHPQALQNEQPLPMGVAETPSAACLLDELAAAAMSPRPGIDALRTVAERFGYPVHSPPWADLGEAVTDPRASRVRAAFHMTIALGDARLCRLQARRSKDQQATDRDEAQRLLAELLPLRAQLGRMAAQWLISLPGDVQPPGSDAESRATLQQYICAAGLEQIVRFLPVAAQGDGLALATQRLVQAGCHTPTLTAWLGNYPQRSHPEVLADVLLPAAVEAVIDEARRVQQSPAPSARIARQRVAWLSDRTEEAALHMRMISRRFGYNSAPPWQQWSASQPGISQRMVTIRNLAIRPGVLRPGLSIDFP